MKGQKTGGRQKGTPNKDKAELLARFVEVAGKEPMEVIALAVKSAIEQNEYAAAAQIAKDALPYMYARLAQIEHKGEVTQFVMEIPSVSDSSQAWEQETTLQ